MVGVSEVFAFPEPPIQPSMQFNGTRALVMGLGIHGGGLGVARFLAEQGADVTVTDLRGPELLRSSIEALAGLPIRFVLGEHREEDFRNAELVVRNPAVPASASLLQIARAAGARIEMEMTLFFRLCPGPILGVTGTKGKTTTTMLLGAMVREQFPDTVLAGNLRVSALEQLPRISANTPVVLELSSFVLEGLGEAQLSPPFACVTNLSADHLDRYGTMEAYAAAKEQIFLHQRASDVVALNADDPHAPAMAARAPGRLVWFGSERDGTRTSRTDDPRRARRPRSGEEKEAVVPANAAEAVVVAEGGVMWRRAGREQLLVPGADVRLPGAHNQVNVAAAAAVALAFGVAPEAIRRAVRGFAGVEHRLETVRELDGVRYVNDTAATAPEAAIAALESFDAPIVLVAGGADKNLPFEGFADAIAARAKAVVLLAGSATAKLQDAIRRSASSAHTFVVLGPYDDFAQAVRVAREQAEPGDVVLLSPGCASFGMFRNEFHRGEEFRRLVGELTIDDWRLAIGD
jgi:UDP-N-acetylmuramoylalanine--D-glutamate ligase